VLDRTEPVERLPSVVSQRLEAFTRALESISIQQLTLLGARPLDTETHEHARAAADERIQWHAWQDAVLSMRHDLLQWMIRRFSQVPRSEVLPFAGVSDSLHVADELRIGQSLADALRAIVVWDEIDDGYRDELLGAWSALVDTGA
jgi:hypothetical protein